jgi:thiamine biosynthesis lipoprotein
MFWNRPLMIALCVGILVLTWWHLHPEGEEVRRSQLLMGTVVEIMAFGEEHDQVEKAVDAAFSEMTRLEKLLSSYQPDSEVSRLSENGTSFEVTQETAAVLAQGLDVARRSNGAFDMTLGRLKSLWGFDTDHPALPDEEQIPATLAGIGPDALDLSGRHVSKRNPRLQLDLGGIAKGYAVDRAIVTLKRHGIESAAVNAGGDIYLLGKRDKRPWRIGIQHPRQKGEVLETVQVSNHAVVTSGDYERFFEQDGQRYHHIFDPQSGFPARKCQSVTIITDSVALGDALATAAFVMGPQAGLQLLSEYPGTEGLIVAADGRTFSSSGWSSYQVTP